MVSRDSRRAPLPPNRVLLFIVHDCRIPVELSHFHSILAPYSSIERILLWHPHDSVKVLIQLSSVAQAIRAHEGLQGKRMFDGCNVLEVNYSGLKELVISKPSERAKDYTQGDRHRGEEGEKRGRRDDVSEVPYTSTAPSSHSPPARSRHSPSTYTNGSSRGGPRQSTSSAHSFSSAPVGGGGGRVLLASNLDPDLVTLDQLVSLFSSYGNVVRVKLLYRSRGAAFVQLESHQQAEAALQHLRGLLLHGRAMTLSVSKNVDIEPDCTELYREFNPPHPLHRFHTPHTTTLDSPSATLYVTGVSEEVSEEELKTVFSVHGKVEEVVLSERGGERGARVRMSGVEEAVKGIMGLDSLTFKGSRVRVAFTDLLRGKEGERSRSSEEDGDFNANAEGRERGRSVDEFELLEEERKEEVQSQGEREAREAHTNGGGWTEQEEGEVGEGDDEKQATNTADASESFHSTSDNAI